MTNGELGGLFPIILSDYDPVWKTNYEIEKGKLEKLIGVRNIIRINHCGSTAVPGLLAKPTIDILLEIVDNIDREHLIEVMQRAGYIYLSKPENPPPGMMFIRGYTEEGFQGQTYHVHVRYRGDWDELYFRDYLIVHKEIAEEYARLKTNLKERFEFDRDGYTDAKTEFISRCCKLAREEMPGKYIL